MNCETVVLIPNYNGRLHLFECLSAVMNQSIGDYQVIMIDDGSTDDSNDFVRRNFPRADIFHLAKNSGFAIAMNAGINYALEKYSPSFIAVLNNDTKVERDWLKQLLTAIKQEKNIASVASNMLFYGRPDVINSQGGTTTILGHGQDINAGLPRAGTAWPARPFSACWGATLISVEAIKAVGLLDENYLAYSEDLDWGWRANLLGFKTAFAPLAVVYHKGSASYNDYELKYFLCLKNNLRNLLKNYQAKTLLTLLPIILLYNALLSIGFLLNLKINNYRLIRALPEKVSWRKKLSYFALPWRAMTWNLVNIKDTLKQRRRIQASRKISDMALFRTCNIKKWL